ncbi:MAG: hypothetical protein ICV87_02335, partial [Gemmatimonadetes bacterium]|nr:hypothetical protein [Gemmatimonadota bacterium]
LAWAVRLLLLVYTGGILYVSTLYLARFLRPSHVWALLSGDLPVFTRVEGTARVLGQELTVNADIDETGGDRLVAVEKRLDTLEQRLDGLRWAAGELLEEPDAREEQNG